MDPRKYKRSTARLAADLSALVLTDGKPPAEFRIFRAGVNQSDYGPLLFDDIAAQLLIGSHQEKGNPLYFDYNHGMADPYADAERAKSAGTFDLEVRAGELWAVRCMWTEEAAERISKREYNLFSPYFRQFCDEQGVCRPYEFINCAILNLAGLDNLQPIAAGANFERRALLLLRSLSTHDREDPMTDELIKELRAQLERANTETATLKQEIAGLRGAQGDLVALGAAVGLQAAAGQADRIGAITGLVALRGEVLKITGQDTAEGAVAAIRGLKTQADDAVALRAQIEEGTTKALRAEFDGVLDAASKAGKLEPAQRGELEKSLLVLSGGKVTPAVVNAARIGVGMLGVKVTTTQANQPPTNILPSNAEARMDRLMNVDGAAFQKWQAEQAARAPTAR